MADVNKSISINFEGKTDDLQSELRKIPTVTRRAATQMAGQLSGALDKAAKRAEKVTKAMSRSFKSVGGALSRVGIASAAAGAAVFLFAQRMADLNNQLTDASTRSGLAIDTLAGLKLAAEGSGLGFESLERGLNRFPQAIQAARDGSKPIVETFEQLGITIDDLESQDVDTLFRRVATEIGKIQDPAQKAAASMRLFGGAAGAGLLQSGALENLQSFVDLTSEFGLDTGPKAVQEAANFQRAVAEIGTVVQGLGSDFLQMVTGTSSMSDALFTISDGLVFFGTVAQDVMSGVHDVLKATGQLAFFNFATDVARAMKVAKLAVTGHLDAAKNLATVYLQASNVKALKSVELLGEGLNKITGAAENATDRLELLAQQRQKILSTETAAPTPSGDGGEDEDKQTEASKRLAEQQAKNAALAQQIAGTEAAAKAELAAITKQATDAGLTAHQLEIQAIDERIAKVSELAMVTGDHDQAYETMRKLQAQRDKAIHDNKMAMLKEERETALEMASIVASSVGSTAASIQTLLENTGNITKRQAVQLFMLQKAAGVAEIAINTSVAITKALAQLGPIGGPVAAGFMAAAGAAQTAAVLSQPPPAFDVGGMVGRTSGSDVVQASLLTGEAVLDRATVRRMGGEDGINAMQRGDMPQQQVVVVQPFKHFDKFIQASSRRGRYNTGRRRPLGVGSY